MNEYAIKISGLTKCYRIYKSPSSIFLELFSKKKRHTEFWSLNGIDLTLQHGKILGIIGPNGAGKSTLLKILSGTLEKTSGSLDVRGIVTAILELGSGFHPEYTGRENITLGGMCLGMTRKEIRKKESSIIEFSELGDFIDQPFRTYSSGMQARLTFATALSVDPDILIIDEALSVGDARFQIKSFDRIREFKKRGKTILLVSHDMSAITSFCDEVIYLDGGKVKAIGKPKEISQYYHRVLFGEEESGKQGKSNITASRETDEPLTQISSQTTHQNHQLLRTTDNPDLLAVKYGDQACEVTHYALLNSENKHTTVISSDGRYTFVMLIAFNKIMKEPSLGIIIRDKRGADLFGVTNISIGQIIPAQQAGNKIEVRIELDIPLATGSYFVSFGIAHGQDKKADFYEAGIELQVTGSPGAFTSSIVDMKPAFFWKEASYQQ